MITECVSLLQDKWTLSTVTNGKRTEAVPARQRQGVEARQLRLTDSPQERPLLIPGLCALGSVGPRGQISYFQAKLETDHMYNVPNF